MGNHSGKSVKSRQAWLVEPGRFEIRDVEILPGAEDVLVKVRVCGLCNWELNHWKGKIGSCPQTLGHEIAGTVIDSGSVVPSDIFKKGQPVTGFVSPMAGFADYALIPYKDCIKLAANVPLNETLGEPLACAVTTLRGAGAETGDVGVVFGCGPMGLWCIQGLAGKNLAALIAIDLDTKKLSLARQFGATHIVNPKESKVAESIAEVSESHGADFVIEGTGHPQTLNDCIDSLRVGRGRLILMSSHEEGNIPFDWRKTQAKGVQILVTHPAYALDIRDNLRRACLLLNRGTFNSKEIISHSFTLKNIGDAFKTLENKPAGYIKGVIDFREDE